MPHSGFTTSVWRLCKKESLRPIIIRKYFLSLKYNSGKIRKMNRIKEVLQEKGISQTWLANKLGKSFKMVNNYACNRSQPSLKTLTDIAKILDVDVKGLIR